MYVAASALPYFTAFVSHEGCSYSTENPAETTFAGFFSWCRITE